jgi:hypothetical protein
MGNERGSFLLEGLIGAVIVSLAILVYVSHLNRQAIHNARERTKISVLTVARNLNQNLLNDDAWLQTVDSSINTAEFDCVRCSGTSCQAGRSTPFTPLDAAGAQVVRGLDVLGSDCDPVSAGCYVQADVTWMPICPAAGACYPSQAEITVVWRQGSNSGGQEYNARFNATQKIIKNFPSRSADTFNAVIALNSNASNMDCPCGSQSAKSNFHMDLPRPGDANTVKFCQPRGFSPPGQAAYRLTYCGGRGAVAPCTPACDSGYNLIQNLPYTVPPDGPFAGYVAALGVCENPTKAPRTSKRIVLAMTTLCPAGYTEESATNLNVGSRFEILRLCTQPR